MANRAAMCRPLRIGQTIVGYEKKQEKLFRAEKLVVYRFLWRNKEAGRD